MKINARLLLMGWGRFIPTFGVMVAWSVLVCPGYAQVAQTPKAPPTVSPRAKAFVSERWNGASFSQGVAIVADPQEVPTARAAAMEVLHNNRGKLTPDEMRSFLSEATRLAKDASLDETNSAFALRVMANVALTMKDQGLLSEAESKKEAGFLVGTATDSRRNVQLRGSAIIALGILKITDASEALREMLTNSVSVNVPEIARPACLSLMRIEGSRAVSALTGVLKRTADPRVFGTAAFALGQLKERACVTALVENLDRFPDTGACDAALVEMGDVICGMLSDPKEENLGAAIQATRHLWREGQRETYSPLLRNLISNASLTSRKAALERLIEAASCLDFETEKRELALVAMAIAGQSELREYQARIQSRLSAAVVTPLSDGAVQIPAVPKGVERK